MPKPKKMMMSDLAAERRDLGLKKFQDWLVDNPEARRRAKKYIKNLNHKFNCIKLGE